MVNMYYVYIPFYYITIKRETPLENIFFYLYILSEKNDFDLNVDFVSYAKNILILLVGKKQILMMMKMKFLLKIK